MSDFDQAKYIQEYQKEKYDRCIFNVPKGQKKAIQEHFKKKGYSSLNMYINDLIRRDMYENNENASKIVHIDTNDTININ